MRIRTRIITSALAVVAAVNVVYLAYFLDKSRSEALAALEARIAETNQLLEVVIAGPLYDGNVEQISANLDSFFRNPDLVEIALKEHGGDISVTQTRAPPEHSGRLLESRILVVRGIDPLGEIRATYTTANIERRLAESRNGILLFSAATMLGIFVVIYLVARTFTRPIDQLAQAARAMAHGDLDREFSVSARGAEELVILGQSFSRMRDAIREKIADLAENNRKLNEQMVQRREAEEQRDRMISVVEATTDLVSMADPQGHIIYLNRAGRAMTGVGTRPLSEISIPSIHPEWAARLVMEEGIPTAIRDGAWSGETALLGPERQKIPVSQVILSHKDGHGNLLYLSTIMRDIGERKRAEEALRLTQLAVDQSRDAVFWVDASGRVVKANDQACRGLGRTHDELTTMHVWDFDPNLIAADWPSRMDQLRASGSMLVTSVHRRKDGSTFPVEVSANYVRHGDKEYNFSFVRDVTERQETEKRLRLAQEIIDKSKAFFWMDPTGKVIDVNDLACRSLGYSRNELIGMHIWDFDPDFPAEAHPAAWEEIKSNGSMTLQTQHRRRDGSTFPVEVTANYAQYAGQEFNFAFVQDISDRRRAEEAVRRSEERYTLAAQIGQSGAWEMWPEEGKIFFDGNLTRLLGYTENELSEDLADWVRTIPESARDDVAAALRAVVEGHSDHYTLEHPVRRKDGSIGWVYVKGERVSRPGETPLRLIGSSVDITERKLAEEALHRLNAELEERVAARTKELAAANRELESFSYSVSHDLRAPLRGIDGFAKLLGDRIAQSGDEVARGYVQRVRQGAQRMGRLIDELLEFARIGRGAVHREEVDLTAMAHSIAEELRGSAPDRAVTWRIADDLRAFADPGLIRIVLENLLGNAWKYSAKTEHATIELFKSDVRPGEVEFCVRDNGAGFDMRFANMLFRPFKRLHGTHEFEGTGIGLATVRRVIERHGGAVRAAGTVDEGASFWFSLPDGGGHG